jgi:hypothetical protein
MKKVVFYATVFLLLFSVFSCGGNLKDPMKAPELKGEELEDFLRFPIKYGPTQHSDSVRDIFYSGSLMDGMEILTPRNLGAVKKVKYYAIIIRQIDNPSKTTILYFENAPASVTKFTKLQQGDVTRYQNKMNPILLALYPNGYFEQVAIEIAEYEEGEPERAAERAARLEKEMYAITHPFEYIKNSSLILRKGIDDVRATVGVVFYPDNIPEGITVEEPYKSGKMYVIPITIKAPADVVKTSIYLDYDEKSKVSLVDKIVVAGNKKTETASTFEEKYQVIMMLLSAMRRN